MKMTRTYEVMSRFASRIHDDHMDMADRDMDPGHMELVSDWLMLDIFCGLCDSLVTEVWEIK